MIVEYLKVAACWSILEEQSDLVAVDEIVGHSDVGGEESFPRAICLMCLIWASYCGFEYSVEGIFGDVVLVLMA